MMYVNETLADLTVAPLEVKLADGAPCSVMLNTLLPRLWIALVTVYHHALDCPFFVGFDFGNLPQSVGGRLRSRETVGGHFCQTLLSFSSSSGSKRCA